MKLTIIVHFSKDDESCGGDYRGVTIEKDGKVIAEYGNYDDDKAEERAEGFIEGVAFCLGSAPEVEWKEVADWGL